MGTDDLRKISRTINTANKEARYASTRALTQHAKIERVRDVVNPLQPFKMQFNIEDNTKIAVKFDLVTIPPAPGESPIVVGTGLGSTDPSGSGTQTIYIDPRVGHFTPSGFSYFTGYPRTLGPTVDDNLAFITNEDLYYVYSPGYTVRPGNVYTFTKQVTITGVGFFSEPSSDFEITVGKTGPGGISDEPYDNPDPVISTPTDSSFDWQETYELATGARNTHHSSYTGGNSYGWHVITGLNYTFSGGDIGIFLFKGTSLRPIPNSNNYYQSVALHDTNVSFFPFAKYYGCNIYQVGYPRGSEEDYFVQVWPPDNPIVSPTIGVNYEGPPSPPTLHGIINTPAGAPVPQYSMMLLTTDSVPTGAEQLDEVPLGINGQSYGDPAYIFGTREFQTLFNYRPGTLRVWINGIQQIIQPMPGLGEVPNYSVQETDLNKFELAEDVAALEDWERITCSYIVG
jgi:hypothetical protein